MSKPEMTETARCEEACIAHIMQQHGQDHAWASRFLHRALASNWYIGDPVLQPLVVAYKNAIDGRAAPVAPARVT